MNLTRGFLTFDENSFSKICDIILKHKYRRVVLQVPDEYLCDCVGIYSYIKEKTDDLTELYITADSSYGTAVDDISAFHVDADLLVYLGTDLSCVGNIPLIVLPPKLDYDPLNAAVEFLQVLLSKSQASTSPVLLLSSPECHHQIKLVGSFLSSQSDYNIYMGALPIFANLDDWTPSVDENYSLVGKEQIGGLLVDSEIIDNPNTLMCYVGTKDQTYNSVCLRLGRNEILVFDPNTKSITIARGDETKIFSQRYGGVLKAKDANIIGIIIGSMGLSDIVVQNTMYRLQSLITASGKKHYTFVMGRLNEAKLCNFPEVIHSSH